MTVPTLIDNAKRSAALVKSELLSGGPFRASDEWREPALAVQTYFNERNRKSQYSRAVA
ncbi:MAG: hypothetical protein JWQ16_1609 [Novosphingobium sp.]|nr:hypothetical protein [Novosphingobium sp.]